MQANQKNHLKSKPQVKVDDTTLQQFLGYHIKLASNMIQADLVQTLKPFELRMLTYTVLVLIVDNPGLRQSQLADALKIDRPNLVVLIDELEERELITRDRVPTDRRAYALHATLAGKCLCEKALAAVSDHEARLFTGLDDETRKKTMAAMDLILNLGRKA